MHGHTSAARPGARLGPYRLCFEIGSGGMATVFLAAVDDRAGIHRFVALKCLKPELASQPDFAAMFLDEARVASQIHHPYVCSVLDLDEQNGVSYMAVEYVAGESLSSVRRRLAEDLASWNPLEHAALVARIVADAAEGLHTAHELVDSQGAPATVIHRDVAPDNLMLTYDGCVKVLDFGVSLCAQNRQKTRSGMVKGKVSYVAPEVIDGARADRRSDVWGLGVVAWELLTGERLFDGATDIESLRAVCSKPIPPPSRVRRGLPAALDRIVLQALERDPAARHATARELGNAMRRFLANRRIAFGLPELAACMDRLFPSGRAAKRQLLETAEQLEAESPTLPHGSCPTVVEPAAPRRRWVPGAAAAVMALLMLAAWARWHHAPEEPRPAPPPVPTYAVSVSPVEASGDTVVLKVQMLRAAATP
jgi:serine/threonine-protein kinase